MKILKKNNYIYLFFIIPIIIFSIETIKVDNDIWFLLNHGRYVINNGFPFIEPFTIHEGLSFVMQQWLISIIYWVIYNYFGKKCLYLFIIIIGLLIVLTFYKLCKTMNNNKILSIMLSVLLALTIKNYVVARPQIFTYLILISEIFILEKYIQSDNKKYLYILPVLSLLQINFHASMWFMQFAFILPFIINAIKLKAIKFGNYKLKPILIITILMFLVGFLNPYGFKSMIYVFNSFGIPYINNYVIEMKPINFNSNDCKIILGCIFFLILKIKYNKNSKLELRHLLLLFGCTILAFMNFKGIPYFYIIYFYVLSYEFKDFCLEKILKIPNKLKKLLKNKYLSSVLFGLKIGFYIMLIFTLFYTLYNSLSNLNYDNAFKESVDVILKDKKQEDIILFVGYNNGGYTEFRGIKSYIDPRAEVFLKKNNKKADIMKELTELENEDFDFVNFINKYEFTHFLVLPNENITKYLEKNEDKYKLIYEQYEEDALIGKVFRTIEE